MATQRVDHSEMEWASAVPFYGPTAVQDGRDIVQLKILSDRRQDGGGIAWLVRLAPPPGKLIKIVATALSAEHVLNLQGGRSTKAGRPVASAGSYSLNPKGQPHSAMIAEETVALVVYAGEPDRVEALELVDIT